ncbi:MAG: hypothetical protein A4S12_06965 [Proteobacteria bacterium SG_bin5]|nr:MAG: hypothetical protein A4S12_06965 [Proteobacteria bacterium SG_bin5]
MFQAAIFVGGLMLLWVGLLGLAAKPGVESFAVAISAGISVFIGLVPAILVARWMGYREIQLRSGETTSDHDVPESFKPTPIAVDLRDLNADLMMWRERAFKAEAALAKTQGPSPSPPSSPPHLPRWSEVDRADIADDPRWFEGETGNMATFVYSDADGVVTDRRIRNWRSRYAYIEGFCLDRREKRTFRKDRIEDWQAE